MVSGSGRFTRWYGAVVARFFVAPGTADRDDTDDFRLAVCDTGTPDFLADTADELSPRLWHPAEETRDLLRVVPQRLRLDEVEPVLKFIRRRFRRVEVEAHAGIRNIPHANREAAA